MSEEIKYDKFPPLAERGVIARLHAMDLMTGQMVPTGEWYYKDGKSVNYVGRLGDTTPRVWIPGVIFNFYLTREDEEEGENIGKTI